MQGPDWYWVKSAKLMGKVRAKVTHQRTLLLTESGLSTFAMLSHWLRAACEKHSFCTSTMVDSNISVVAIRQLLHLQQELWVGHFQSCHGPPFTLNRFISSHRFRMQVFHGSCGPIFLRENSERTSDTTVDLWSYNWYSCSLSSSSYSNFPHPQLSPHQVLLAVWLKS